MEPDGVLNIFAEKIDFTNLKGTPEDFYLAGIDFVKIGQFDDGIVELVKVIKLTSFDNPLFSKAVSQLKTLGFTSSDISEVSGALETAIGENPNLQQFVESKLDGRRGRFLKNYLLILIALVCFVFIVFGSNGGVFILVYAGGPLIVTALLIGVIGYFISSL